MGNGLRDASVAGPITPVAGPIAPVADLRGASNGLIRTMNVSPRVRILVPPKNYDKS